MVQKHTLISIRCSPVLTATHTQVLRSMIALCKRRQHSCPSVALSALIAKSATQTAPECTAPAPLRMTRRDRPMRSAIQNSALSFFRARLGAHRTVTCEVPVPEEDFSGIFRCPLKFSRAWSDNTPDAEKGKPAARRGRKTTGL